MGQFGEFLVRYCSFISKNGKRNAFKGYLKVQNEIYQLEIIIPNYPLICNFQVKIFKGFTEIALKRDKVQEDTWTIYEFLENFEKLLDLKYPDDSGERRLIAQSACQHRELSFLEHLIELKSDGYSIFTNDERSKVRFENFTEYPNHYLELAVSSNFEISINEHSLPFEPEADSYLFSMADCLRSYLGQFQRYLVQLEDFYGNINTIDELCYVVEPIQPTTKHDWRIFKLTEKVFIKIVVDPLCPTSVLVNLIGPGYEVEKFREMYNERAANWDVDLDVHKNILKIFDLFYLPLRTDGCDEEAQGIYCNICYSYLHNEHIPIVRCENERCSLIYHVLCLKEWFATQLSSMRFLNVSMGTCPYCKQKLSTSFDHLLKQS